jgi:hypothetical protein
MDRLEKEVSRLRKLHASGRRENVGHRNEFLWEDDKRIEDKEEISQKGLQVRAFWLTST